jgi:hypothetical protein
MIQENMLTKGNKTFCLISSITFLAQKNKKHLYHHLTQRTQVSVLYLMCANQDTLR